MCGVASGSLSGAGDVVEEVRGSGLLSPWASEFLHPWVPSVLGILLLLCRCYWYLNNAYTCPVLCERKVFCSPMSSPSKKERKHTLEGWSL